MKELKDYEEMTLILMAYLAAIGFIVVMIMFGWILFQAYKLIFT